MFEVLITAIAVVAIPVGLLTWAILLTKGLRGGDE